MLILYDGAYNKPDRNLAQTNDNSIPCKVDNQVSTDAENKTHGDGVDNKGESMVSQHGHGVDTRKDGTDNKHDGDFVETGEKLDVRMIDFSHATFDGFNDSLVHTGPHSGYLFGLENLIRMFRQLLEDSS